MTPFDFFFAAILVIGLGAWARREHSRVEQAISLGRVSARLSGYRRVIVVQWSLIALLGAHWVLTAREVTVLGLALPVTWRMGAGLAISAAGTAFLWYQLQRVRRNEEDREDARKALRDLEWLLPHNPQELDAFMRVSATAGICEEVLYRGFLPWFFAQWMPLWAAMTLSGVLFGLAHAYQGRTGVLKTGIIGIAFGGLTLLAESIVPAILLHIAVDALNGQLAYVVISTPRPRAVVEVFESELVELDSATEPEMPRIEPDEPDEEEHPGLK
jgi:membrane protease YdiL (CAAX protease family)